MWQAAHLAASTASSLRSSSCSMYCKRPILWQAVYHTASPQAAHPVASSSPCSMHFKWPTLWQPFQSAACTASNPSCGKQLTEGVASTASSPPWGKQLTLWHTLPAARSVAISSLCSKHSKHSIIRQALKVVHWVASASNIPTCDKRYEQSTLHQELQTVHRKAHVRVWLFYLSNQANLRIFRFLSKGYP